MDGEQACSGKTRPASGSELQKNIKDDDHVQSMQGNAQQMVTRGVQSAHVVVEAICYVQRFAPIRKMKDVRDSFHVQYLWVRQQDSAIVEDEFAMQTVGVYEENHRKKQYWSCQ